MPAIRMAFEKEDKYAHLLQPIRDLASNWNINIANELEEYLVGILVTRLDCDDAQLPMEINRFYCANNAGSARRDYIFLPRRTNSQLCGRQDIE